MPSSKMINFFVIVLLLLITETRAFISSNYKRAKLRSSSLSCDKKQSQDETLPSYLPHTLKRREFIISAPSVASIMIGGIVSMPQAATAEDVGRTKNNPVAIIGGGGRTGKEVAAAIANEGLFGVAMTRSGKPPVMPGYVKEFVEQYPFSVNVIDIDSLSSALSSVKPSAIVYCASASSKGGTAFQVDDEGVANAANIAKKLDVRFVLVSALGVDRPDSKGFQMTNNIGGNYDKIMDAKRQGEEKTRSILAKSKNYLIIRPGPLLGAKSLTGSSGIELNQGDLIGGGISRDELAGVVVGALLTEKRGITVEVYRAKTRQKLQPEFSLFSGNEVSGADSYVGLFSNVKAD